MGRTKRSRSNWDDDFYGDDYNTKKRKDKKKEKEKDWKDIRKAKIRDMERGNELSMSDYDF